MLPIDAGKITISTPQWEMNAMKFIRITVNPKQMDGMPCIRVRTLPIGEP